MGMDPSSIMGGGGGGGIMGMLGSGASGYSQGVGQNGAGTGQLQAQMQQQQLRQQQQASQAQLQGQAAGIAANQAQRNQSLLAAVQNLKAANSLGATGGLPAAAQSTEVSPQQRIGQANARQQGWESGRDAMPFLQAAQNLVPPQQAPDMLTPDQQWASRQPVTPQQWGDVQDAYNAVNNGY